MLNSDSVSTQWKLEFRLESPGGAPVSCVCTTYSLIFMALLQHRPTPPTPLHYTPHPPPSAPRRLFKIHPPPLETQPKPTKTIFFFPTITLLHMYGQTQPPSPDGLHFVLRWPVPAGTRTRAHTHSSPAEAHLMLLILALGLSHFDSDTVQSDSRLTCASVI